MVIFNTAHPCGRELRTNEPDGQFSFVKDHKVIELVPDKTGMFRLQVSTTDKAVGGGSATSSGTGEAPCVRAIQVGEHSPPKGSTLPHMPCMS